MSNMLSKSFSDSIFHHQVHPLVVVTQRKIVVPLAFFTEVPLDGSVSSSSHQQLSRLQRLQTSFSSRSVISRSKRRYPSVINLSKITAKYGSCCRQNIVS
ncbi:GSCOCG00011011001-RA-CDS [Cotesia congregata]|nr:GSCOCG00011011001-RA-CDS [Cotesia congregata]